MAPACSDDQNLRAGIRHYVPEQVPLLLPAVRARGHLVSEPRVSWGIGASGGHAEYDVPQCADGTPVDECKHTIWVQRPWNPFRRRRPF
jgi:hypothetical protein